MIKIQEIEVKSASFVPRLLAVVFRLLATIVEKGWRQMHYLFLLPAIGTSEDPGITDFHSCMIVMLYVTWLYGYMFVRWVYNQYFVISSRNIKKGQT